MPRWYVVQTKAKQEAIAQQHLERQGYASYCPYVSHSRRWRGTWRKISEPLFPRYLFVQLIEGEDNFAPIRSTIGVSKLIRFGDTAATLSAEALEGIRRQERQLKEEAKGSQPWTKGDRVQIVEGPFAGLSGVFEKKSGEERVFILLEMLGKASRIAINPGNIVPH